MENEAIEAEPHPPHWLTLGATAAIIWFVHNMAWWMYRPYTPAYAEHYSWEAHDAAMGQARWWLVAGIVISYVLFTRRLVRSSWSGGLAYLVMWLFYVQSVLHILALLLTERPSPSDGEPFFGFLVSILGTEC